MAVLCFASQYSRVLPGQRQLQALRAACLRAHYLPWLHHLGKQCRFHRHLCASHDFVRAGHCGVMAVKNWAKSYFWCPEIDKQIEETASVIMLVSQRSECGPRFPFPVGACPMPLEPWQMLHVYFTRSVEGGTFPIVVDVHTEWLIRPQQESSVCCARSLRHLAFHSGCC